ncbi:MAG: DUF4412 domain-containing protein [Acidobacteriota bacterium]|jgi:hypothetical protein|nr:DUF4412 domain-containing protein [Acidobacteriota bacterium]
MKKLVLAVTILAFAAGLAQADIYIKQSTHTNEVTMMGQTTPAKDTVTEQWIGKNRFASHMENQSVIMNLEENMMYMINHQNKSYIPMQLPVDMTDYMPPEVAGMMKSMMGSITVKVTPNNETRTVAGLPCQGYDVTMDMMMMKMNMKVFASEKVGFDWQKVSEQMTSEMLKAQMRLSEEAVKEMQKVKGYWMAMETTVNVMGQDIRTTMEVTEIAEKAPTADAYAVPQGYTKKDKFTMGDLQQQG